MAVFSKQSKIFSFLEKIERFSKKSLFFSVTTKRTKFAVESERNSKISQIVQILGFWENRWFFQKEVGFSKTAEGSKIAVEFNWKWQFSQNVRKIRSLLKKQIAFQKNKNFCLKWLVVRVWADQTGVGGGKVEDPPCIKIGYYSRIVPRSEKGHPAMY